ncbi:MAG: hypothetical protein ACETWT_04090 [Thermodesulfobacteriota bacterium]
MEFKVLEFDEIPEWCEGVEKKLPSSYQCWKGIQTPLTPREFILPTYFTMVSSLIGDKLFVRLGHIEMQPNLWFWLIGVSSRSKKSTIIDLAQQILEEAGGEIFSVMGSVQGLRNSMSKERGEKDKGCVVESEMGHLLSSLDSDHMKPMTFFLCKLKDPPRGEIKTPLAEKEWVIGKGRFVTWLGGAQQGTLFKYLKSQHLASGFSPRFRKVFGEPPRGKNEFPEPVSAGELTEVKEKFKRIREVRDNFRADQKIEFILKGTGAEGLYGEFEGWMREIDDEIDPGFARLIQSPLEYAPLIWIIKELGENPQRKIKQDVVEITPEAMEIAIELTLIDLASQIRFRMMGFAGGGDKQYAENLQTILELVLNRPGLTQTELSRAFRVKKIGDYVWVLENEMEYIRTEKKPGVTNAQRRLYPTESALKIFGGKPPWKVLFCITRKGRRLKRGPGTLCIP